MTRKLNYVIKTPILTLMIGFYSCGSSTWTADQKSNLRDRCEAEGGSSSYCDCYLENAMETYPNAEDMDELDFESAVELSLDCI